MDTFFYYYFSKNDWSSLVKEVSNGNVGQVIESGFQQDRGQADSLENLSRNNSGGKGQVAAIAALKELRKISNLLSEMR